MFTEDFSKGFTHAIVVQSSLVNMKETLDELQLYINTLDPNKQGGIKSKQVLIDTIQEYIDPLDTELRALCNRVGLDDNGLS